MILLAPLLAVTGRAGAAPTTRPATRRPPSLWVLAANYRRFRKDTVKRKAVVEQLLQRGRDGAVRLEKEVLAELRPGYSRYQREFYARAQYLGRRKYRAADKRQIALWQKQVNVLRKDENLSKATLKSRGEPGLTALRKALTVSHTDVLDSSPALKARREAIMALLALQKRCITVAYAGKVPPSRPEAGDLVVQDEKALALMGAPLATSNRRIVESIWRQRGDILIPEAVGLIDLNVMRSLLGLDGLVLDLRLCQAAQGHSRDMFERKFYAHESPVPGKKTPSDRARLAGAGPYVGECIHKGQPTGIVANMGWFLSPGHHKLMLGRYTRAGLGTHKGHWTLMLGR